MDDDVYLDQLGVVAHGLDLQRLRHAASQTTNNSSIADRTVMVASHHRRRSAQGQTEPVADGGRLSVDLEHALLLTVFGVQLWIPLDLDSGAGGLAHSLQVLAALADDGAGAAVGHEHHGLHDRLARALVRRRKHASGAQADALRLAQEFHSPGGRSIGAGRQDVDPAPRVFSDLLQPQATLADDLRNEVPRNQNCHHQLVLL
mmetsp:Transcript_150508/g.481780  ORF Transcript_150508/g.481780 Transcript_150508/m.481780 type:complete len:203 (+) Transcript_150508:1061-1669(+)